MKFNIVYFLMSLGLFLVFVPYGNDIFFLVVFKQLDCQNQYIKHDQTVHFSCSFYINDILCLTF